MEGKNGKDSSSSKTPNEQRSPQRAEGSTRRQPSSGQRQPPPRVQEPPHPSRRRGGRPSLAGRVWGRMPPNLHAIPVGGSSGHATASIGGIATVATSRKRVREVSQGTVAGGGGGDPFTFSCTVCGKGFLTDKSLFGHMRTHRGRPWKGALPPPVFSREEFADTGLLNPDGGEGEGQEEQEVDQQVVQEETSAAAVGIQEARNLNVLQPQGPQRKVRYRVPDLNQSPPREGNEDDDNY